MAPFFYKDNMNIREINGFVIQQTAKDVWAIDEFGIDIMYLILGKEKALLFDTGIGIGDIRAVVREMTEKPVITVNSHHHYDHAGGNGHFDRVFAHKNAVPVIREQNRTEYRKEFFLQQEARPEYNHRASLQAYMEETAEYELEGIEEGEVFDLGGRKLEVLFTPGHTKDCICLLDRDNKLLFSADTIVSTPTLMLDVFSDTMEVYLESLKKLQSLKKHYELIFPGHYIRPIGERYIEDMITCVRKIMENPLAGEKDACGMTQSQVYFFQYGLASVLYTLDRARG